MELIIILYYNYIIIDSYNLLIISERETFDVQCVMRNSRRTSGPGILDSVVEGTAAVMLCKMELINKDSERRASNFPILRKTIL